MLGIVDQLEIVLVRDIVVYDVCVCVCPCVCPCVCTYVAVQ